MLSGAQVTRLWPYGGPGHNYGSFAGKTAAPIVVAARSRRASARNYIIKGKRYRLTNDELAYMLGHLAEEERKALIRSEILVTYKDKKAHPVSKSAWAEIQESLKKFEPEPTDDDEEAAMLLL